MAHDVVGKELKAGQWVAYCLAGKSGEMRVAQIIRVSPKTVELDAPSYDSPWAMATRRPHNAVAIVEKHNG